ncbi:FAD-dependent monooxygenase [Labedaea rhizosphaerae]|uniref:2-polyprenyl-6-methoxyphenol hydroxylase-like FAD-dependent oxidoreductase n=1 Tax=Labedaea rhizosphaerae TaxID=598644 RepID=A0A4R6SQC1_LABRH|nr:FAD-dependent monooxygenase [Labedaea rhizosphaerae]TDQ05473.1 2-polyprenyl-6-methoxyphenol hydroxylase-like FAD-dependent oxidoreductase [Labedaea rhizosphaerae]
MSRTAVVVGGGIGGLAAAAGLTRNGWQVTVLERAPRFEAIGAGITIMTNALKGLAAFGLEEQVRAGSQVDRGGGFRTPNGKWLTRTDTAKMRALGIEIVALHRAELHRIVLEAVPAECLTPGATVTGVHNRPDGATVEYTVDGEGRSLDADLVVAADGIHSTVRTQLWPAGSKPKYSGTTAWRAVTKDPVPDQLALTQTWGDGVELGIVPLTDGRVYWFVASAAPEGERFPDELRVVRERYGDWHAPISQLFDATDPNTVMRHDIYHLSPPLKSYVDKRVVLLGDAAHAMVPNLGQGACQAIEDAVTLAVLARGDDLDAALAQYDRLRVPRSQKVAATSLRLADLGMHRVRGKLLVGLRNLVMRLAPASSEVKMMRWLAEWTPPSGPR